MFKQHSLLPLGAQHVLRDAAATDASRPKGESQVRTNELDSAIALVRLQFPQFFNDVKKEKQTWK
jgi:hypothetical protein